MLKYIATLTVLLVLLTHTTNAQAKFTFPVEVKENQQVFVDDEQLFPQRNGKYKYKKKYYVNQAKIKEEGYIERYLAVGSDNKYTKYTIPERVKVIEPKSDKAKYLHLNDFKVDIDLQQKSYITYRSGGGLRTNYYPKKQKLEDSGFLQIEEELFSYYTFDKLVKSKFIDTTNVVLQNVYNSFNKLNIVLEDLAILQAAPLNAYSTNFIKTRATLKFELLDVYNNLIVDTTLLIHSGEIVHASRIVAPKDQVYGIFYALTNTIDIGLSKFLNSKEVRKELQSKAEVEKFEPFIIEKSTKTVSELTEAIEATVTILLDDSHGSGFVISEDGYIITNYHVIAEASESIKIIDNNGNEYTNPKIVRVSKVADLALLKIENVEISPLRLNVDNSIKVSEDIFAIGTPHKRDLSQTLSKGIISGIRKLDDNERLLQFDASVSGGNSGGPLVNKSGELVGVVNSKISGYGVEGLGFAIPANEIFSKLNIEYKK